MRALRLISVFIAAVALLATASPVVADTRDVDAFSIPFLPCQAGVPDVHTPAIAGTEGAYPHACFVPMMGPGIAWQASTGEWILFNWDSTARQDASSSWRRAASLFRSKRLPSHLRRCPASSHSRDPVFGSLPFVS